MSYADYSNNINKPTSIDRLGGTFRDTADKNPSITPKQRAGNALMRGFGDGLSMSQDKKRSEKAEALERHLKDLTLLDMDLKTKMGKNQLETETYVEFGRDNFYDMKALDTAFGEGDVDTQERLSKNLLSSLRQSDPEMAKTLGDFVGIKGDNYLFETPDGGIRGVNRKNVFQGVLANMSEDRQRELVNLQTSHIKKSFEDNDNVKQLQMGKTGAQINQINADVKHKLSQNNITEIDKNRASQNYTHIKDDIQPRVNVNNKLLGLYENLQHIVKDNPDLVGRDLLTKVRRSAYQYLGGGDEDIDFTKLNSVQYEMMLKDILGAQMSEKEGERVLDKFPSLNNNIHALDKHLNSVIKDTNLEIKQDKHRLQLYNQNPTTNLFDPHIGRDLEAEKEGNSFFHKPDEINQIELKKRAFK